MLSVPAQHKAALFAQQGGKAYTADRATPKPRDDEVLIKIIATAINPVDWKMREWGIFVEQWPFVAGSDAAGEIAQAGSKATEFKPGDRVLFQGILTSADNCTFQEYCVMPAELVAHIPKALSDEAAAGVSLASMANIAGFFHSSGLEIKPRPWEAGGSEAGKGKSIVIIGGSSSVGQYAIQLARLSGFSNIITNSSPAHHNFLKELGANVVLDRNHSNPADFAEAAKKYPLGVVIESISSLESGLLAVEILKAANSSDMLKETGLSQPTIIFFYHIDQKLADAAKAANVAVKDVWGIGSAPHLRPVAVEFMKAISGEEGWLATGQYKPNRPLVIKGGLPNIEEALTKNKEGVSGHKVIIRPHDKA